MQVVIATGGTGITSRDSTYEAIGRDARQATPGFGELFRMLSYQETGAAAMLSRAQLGIHARRIVVSLPGSPNACRLALEKLLIPELPSPRPRSQPLAAPTLVGRSGRRTCRCLREDTV